MAQEIMDITLGELMDKARKYQAQGFRLVQICCTKLPDTLELQYSFDKEYDFKSLRLTLPDASTPVPSISGVYLPAFLYENEIHDLFGINVHGMAVDYKGHFYMTAIKTPFNQPAQAEEKKA
ncbi:MAG: NADH-quinone oxidoreductase subunit C [Candidatus Omnitrophica bacterium]|nr:NADH-quinone oxidoreductase subunit C [Candidatus Omnitrophota bacterium]